MRTTFSTSHPAPDSSHLSAVTVYPMTDYAFAPGKPGSFLTLSFEEGHTAHLNRFAPHRHDFFEVIWIREGSCCMHSDLQCYAFGPPTLVFVSPGQVHYWELAEAARGEIVSFSAEFLGMNAEHPGLLAKMPFLYGNGAEPILRLNRIEARKIDHLIRQVRAASADPAPGRDDIVRAYLTIILSVARQYYLRRQAFAPNAPGVETLVHRFRIALEERFPSVLEVGEFAELLHVSRSHLNDELRRQTGRSASEIIHERVLLEAKRLIMHAPLTIAEIAYRLRFQDPSYFGRFFRKYTGQSPGAFRRFAHHEAIAS